MNSTITLPWSLLYILRVIPLWCISICYVMAAELPKSMSILGSGAPGLKVISHKTNKNSFAIYLDEPKTVGIDLLPGYDKRDILLIVDHGYGFNKKDLNVNGISQLYPFDSHSAFTCEGGEWGDSFKHWIYEPRGLLLYSYSGGSVIKQNDVQGLARKKYGLSRREIFLGFIDGNIFYWRSFDPSKVFWKKFDVATEWFAPLPKGVIDIFGATRGLKKDIGFSVFRKSSGTFHYAPYDYNLIEISIAEGRESVSSKK